MVKVAIKWLTSEARWFASADWKWGLIPLAVAVAIYGPVLFGVKLGALMGVQID